MYDHIEKQCIEMYHKGEKSMHASFFLLTTTPPPQKKGEVYIIFLLFDTGKKNVPKKGVLGSKTVEIGLRFDGLWNTSDWGFKFLGSSHSQLLGHFQFSFSSRNTQDSGSVLIYLDFTVNHQK